MTTFFEIISTSAPHIYRSALPLSPPTSIVRELYKPHARPLIRVVQGLSVSWEPIISAPEHGNPVAAVAWSPCSGFIAVARAGPYIIEILDHVTLEPLNTFESPSVVGWLRFSPDSRLLVQLSHTKELTNWDLQTGGPVGTIHSDSCVTHTRRFSSAHSGDGKIVVVVHGNADTTGVIISAYDLSSGTRAQACHVLGGHIAASIWTHGECVRFVTVKPGTITVWEVGFTSIHTPTEVESLPAPGGIDCWKECLFLPAPSRLAFTFQEAVLVWDAQGSRVLLNFLGGDQHARLIFPDGRMSFSSDGRVFAYRATSHETYLWQESPDGYILQNVIPSDCGWVGPLLSPNGESIIIPGQATIQVQRVADPLPPISDLPIHRGGWHPFILEFSPDGALVAIARVWENTATVLDIKSGDLRLVIDAGTGILGLGLTQSSVVVIAEGKVVTWNLPAEDCVLSTRVDINDSIRATVIDYSTRSPGSNTLILAPHTSMSPNFNYVAVTHDKSGGYGALNIYDVSTGKCLTGTRTNAGWPWFSPDGREVWCLGSSSVERWRITEGTESGLTKLEPLEPTADLPGCPWKSPRGYRVRDEWVLDSGGKRLMWLPRRWRSEDSLHMWGGRFLGLLHDELPDAVILEFNE